MDAAKPATLPISSLSAGEILCEVLMNSPVAGKVNDIYPVVQDSATLPYIVYRRSGFEETRHKGILHNDSVNMEVLCLSQRYGEGVAIAELVREALDGVSARSESLEMRSCVLTDADEDWTDDAYVQRLVFTLRITPNNK